MHVDKRIPQIIALLHVGDKIITAATSNSTWSMKPHTRSVVCERIPPPMPEQLMRNPSLKDHGLMPCTQHLIDFKAAWSAGCGLLSAFEEAPGNLSHLTSPPEEREPGDGTSRGQPAGGSDWLASRWHPLLGSVLTLEASPRPWCGVSCLDVNTHPELFTAREAVRSASWPQPVSPA